MTVQPSVRPPHQSREHEEKYVFAQIKEITGINDERVIREAIQACEDKEGRYDVSNVVNMLVDDSYSRSIRLGNASTSGRGHALTQSVSMLDARTEGTSDRGDALTQSVSMVDAKAEGHAKRRSMEPSVKDVAVGGQGHAPVQGPLTQAQAAQGVIDLTNEPEAANDDLRKAIAASLQENNSGVILGGQVSREEQDISRVLEQSLIEVKAGTKRKRPDIWFVDPLNPHERKRQEGCPVGLKNVGNTCWFSAVIQSLFYVRKFRHLVLNFEMPKDARASESIESRNVRFMRELRYLFGLMIGSQKKYVDPSQAVDILKEAFAAVTPGMTDSQQQDVSEFQHKLLEWLEDAFKSEASKDNSGTGDANKKSNNPMVELFYGQYRTEGVNEGKDFSNEETFGQFPLQVNGFRDIHESLEAATAPGKIETVSGDATQSSGQELWFTRLPPLLTFELSRFQFNQQLGTPEKIHNKIDFPEVIYLDRYLLCNKDVTRSKRERLKKLRDELAVLNTRLNKYNHYGSGSKKVPIQDVLSYALEFAQSKPEQPCVSQDVEMESPKPHSISSETSMMTDSPIKSPAPEVSMAPATPTRPVPIPATENPTPRHISDDELRVLEDCLQRWRKEVESDVRELQENINRLESTVNAMYLDSELVKYPYHLHAVLVHEGQAASGHYWAYIYDEAGHQWLKFNDITVTDVTWEEVVKESAGGFHNASAYCLMYVDRAQLAPADSREVQSEGEFEALQNDLREAILEDNRRFQEELLEWDKQQQAKAAAESKAESEGKKECRTEDAPKSCSTMTQTPSPVERRLNHIHADLATDDVQVLMQQLFVSMENQSAISIEKILEKIIKDEQTKIQLQMRSQQLKKNVDKLTLSGDRCLVNPVWYLIGCNAHGSAITSMMYEQIVLNSHLEQTERMQQVRHVARMILKGNSKSDFILEEWHKKYDEFRKAVFFFVTGLKLFNNEQFDKALPYLMEACTQFSKQEKRGQLGIIPLDKLKDFRRKCLLSLNTVAVAEFEAQDNVVEILKKLTSHLLPCLLVLLSSRSPEDAQAVELIREKWCAFVGQEISEKKIEALQDFLSKLVEVPQDCSPPPIRQVQAPEMSDLKKQLMNVLEVAKRHGYLTDVN